MKKEYPALVERVGESFTLVFNREMLEQLQLIQGEILFCEVSEDSNTLTIKRKTIKDEDDNAQ